MKEADDEEEDSLVLPYDDASLPPAISITGDGEEVCGSYFVRFISGNIDQWRKMRWF